MLNPVSNLAAYVKSIGKAYIYYAADPTASANWNMLAITEGDIVVDEKYQYNDYKLPEWSGDAVHYREIDGQDLHITAPLIWGASNLYNLITPSGSRGGGRTKPIPVQTYTVLVVPYSEVTTGLSNGAGGQTWTPAAPVHALWLHKATFEPGQYHFKHGEGGKIIRSIGIRTLFDATKPEGQMLYTIGDPYPQGITTYRI